MARKAKINPPLQRGTAGEVARPVTVRVVGVREEVIGLRGTQWEQPPSMAVPGCDKHTRAASARSRSVAPAHLRCEGDIAGLQGIGKDGGRGVEGVDAAVQVHVVDQLVLGEGECEEGVKRRGGWRGWGTRFLNHSSAFSY